MEKFYKKVSDNNISVTSVEDGEPIPVGAVEITEAEFTAISEEIAIKLATISFYREKVNNGEMVLMDVPEEYIEEVKSAVNFDRVITNGYGILDKTLQQIQDDTVADLIKMGVL